MVESKLPEASVEKVTVPVGVVGDALLSVTIAVHELDAFTATDAGVQVTDVDVL